MSKLKDKPVILILNQMAGPMTWELAEDAGEAVGCVALLTGHPDTLQKSHEKVLLYPAAAYRRGSFVRRALSWLHYWLQAFFWLWRWPKETPLLLFSNPPILCWLGWLMSKLRGQRYSVMVHDIYPDILVRMTNFSESQLLIRLWRWLNRRAYERADVVMTLGEYMAETLAQQFDPVQTRHGRIEVVYPWVDTEKIKPIPKEENWFAQKYDQVDKLTVMYSGNMGLGHDIETMLEAARRLQDVPEIHFMLIGAGPKWQMVWDAKQNEVLDNVTVLDWQTEETMPYSLATADVALVSLEDEFQGLAVPSKLLSALAAGSMVVVLAGSDNEISTWVTKFGAGIALKPKSPVSLTHLKDWLSTKQVLLEPKENARTSAVTVFSRRSVTNSCLHLLTGVFDVK